MLPPGTLASRMILSQSQEEALTRIKELLAQTPRPPISTIAKEISYPRGTAGYVKQMTGPGEL
jgi:hypothetical protein